MHLILSIFIRGHLFFINALMFQPFCCQYFADFILPQSVFFSKLQLWK